MINRYYLDIKTFKWKNNIVIEYLQNIADNPDLKFYPYSAAINNAPEEDILTAGEKCLVLAYDDERNFENIIKLSYDEKEKIKRIDSIRKTKAFFDIETYPRNTDQLNETDSSLEKAVYCRAELLGFINKESMNYENFIERYESVQKEKDDFVLEYTSYLNIDRLNKDEEFREKYFNVFFRQIIGDRLKEFDKDNQELINLRSGKFGIDYYYRCEVLKEMESTEVLRKVIDDGKERDIK